MADLRTIAQELYDALRKFYPEGQSHCAGCSDKIHGKNHPKARRCQDVDHALKLAEAAGFKPREYCPCCRRVVGEHPTPTVEVSVAPAVPVSVPVLDTDGVAVVGLGSMYGKH